MTDTPISFTAVQLRPIVAGRKVETRRPAGRYTKLVPGVRLWVREPFHLAVCWDAFAPTSVLDRIDGVSAVAFTADHADGFDMRHAHPNVTLGKRRFAREMPRALHRYHLVLRGVRSERLHDIDEIGARAEGCTTRADFRAQWDAIGPGAARTITGDRVEWATNPLVDVLAFTFVARPLPAPAPCKEKRS